MKMNPSGFIKPRSCLFRGGSWFSDTIHVRPAIRDFPSFDGPDARPKIVGFRVIRICAYKAQIKKWKTETEDGLY